MMWRGPIRATPAAAPLIACDKEDVPDIATAGEIRHTIEAASIIPAQYPKKISLHLCGIRRTTSPNREPAIDAAPNAAAVIITLMSILWRILNLLIDDMCIYLYVDFYDVR